ncbi:hypothetical protein BCN_0832 [Bacillus cereus NC7401]|nr:hypothetical protein BCN_0832 [Bacillus cereus NC7401]
MFNSKYINTKWPITYPLGPMLSEKWLGKIFIRRIAITGIFEFGFSLSLTVFT